MHIAVFIDNSLHHSVNISTSSASSIGLRRSRFAYTAVLFVVPSLIAQLSLTSLNSTVTITFDSTLAGVSNGAFSGAGFQSSPASGQLDSDAWAVTGWDNGNLSFGGAQTTAGTDYTRGTITAPGVATTGGIYSYSSSGNRSLMIQSGTSDWAPGTLTLKVQNNTGHSLTGITIGYDLFVRNDQQRSSSFNFSYSTNNSSYTQVPSLNYTSIAASDALGRVQVTSPATSTPTSITLTALAPNSFIYLRWSGADVGGSGSRDELFLDNIAVKGVSAVPEPTTYATIAACAALLAAAWQKRRRSSVVTRT